MKTIFLGLGGSGIAVVQNVKKLLREKLDAVSEDQRPALQARFGEVEAIVIDTDQNDLSDAAKEGIKTIRLSSSGKVEDYINALGGDVTDWCPCTGNESEFLSSSVDKGASQCRFKSRLCLACYLKDNNNDLHETLKSLVAANGKIVDRNIRIMIVSSIAGGTGSGIFIQVALYIKKFFQKLGAQIHITGLFSCPGLYRDVVKPEQVQSIYANAYAVIRELNALNLIYSNSATEEYGKNTDIKISSRCEGNLFSSEMSGHYDYKPYDTLYFVDEYNAAGMITAIGKDAFYEKMANIVYGQMFSPLSESAMDSQTDNEMSSTGKASLAIYGSAGAATMEYPYNDILRYVSARFLKESFEDMWCHFDDKWHTFVSEKRADYIAAGKKGQRFNPTPEARRRFFLTEFRETVFADQFSEIGQKFSLLKNGLNAEDEKNNIPKSVSDFIDLTVRDVISQLINKDSFLSSETEKLRLTNELLLEDTSSLASSIEGASGKIDSRDFESLATIEYNLSKYADDCTFRIQDIALQTASRLLCVNEKIWDTYTDIKGSIVQHILKDENGKYLHPLTVRYLLYCLKEKINEYIVEDGKLFDASKKIIKCNADIKKEIITNSQNLMLDSDPEGGKEYKIADVLSGRANIPFVGRGIVVKFLTSTNEKGFVAKTLANKKAIENRVISTIQKIALKKFSENLDVLIKGYESFFDDIPEYLKLVNAEVNQLSDIRSEDGAIVYYTGSNAESTDEIYKKLSEAFNVESEVIVSVMAKSVFESIRDSAWRESNTGKTLASVEDKLIGIIMDSIEEEPEVCKNVDKDIFTAILKKYESLRGSYDTENFAKNRESQINVLNHIKAEMKELIVRAAPSIQYDMLDKSLNDGNLRVDVNYRYLLVSGDTANAIKNLYGMKDRQKALQTLCDEILGEMPADKRKRKPGIVGIISDEIGKNTMYCFCAVRLLQPFQIANFDELRGGEYYRYYSERIADMLKFQKFSLSPHLDKTWHQRGKMPYINRDKESESRHRIIKALIYALITEKIVITENNGVKYYIMYDPKLQADGVVPLDLSYDGKVITEGNYAPLIYCLESREDICNIYADRFDKNIDAEVNTVMSKMSKDIRYLEGEISKAQIIKFLRTRMIAASSADTLTGARRVIEVKRIGALKLAVDLRKSEERRGYKDYNSAELLLSTVADIIDKFCRSCFSEEDLEKNESEKYRYAHMKLQQGYKFLEAYVSNVGYKAEIVEDMPGKTESDADGAKNGQPVDSSEKFNDVTEISRGSSPIVSKGMSIKVPPEISGSFDYKWLLDNFLVKLK